MDDNFYPVAYLIVEEFDTETIDNNNNIESDGHSKKLQNMGRGSIVDDYKTRRTNDESVEMVAEAFLSAPQQTQFVMHGTSSSFVHAPKKAA